MDVTVDWQFTNEGTSNENLHRDVVIHGDGEYVDGDVHVNTYESTRRWCDGGSRPTEAFQKTH